MQIHHSRDLANWTLVSRPLSRASQLDMRGDPDSCGIWAPCLSWADGLFWLVYTDVKRYDGSFKDAHNYIVTAPAIEGPWSDGIYVNSWGFDPSLFHDDDGKKWFLNLVWNHRGPGIGGSPKHPSFAGIIVQEWDHEARTLKGEPRMIYEGTDLGLTEGPHLYKKDGWYYLTVAEGGTGYSHAVTMARSRDLMGPYETHPEKHLITSKDAPDAVLQRAGHGQIVETPDGQTYHTHLCSRPLPGTRMSPLGRETAIQRCEWRDGWLWLADGGMVPSVEVVPPDGMAETAGTEAAEYVFDGDALPADFQWLRTPEPERIFTMTGGALRLHGRESLGSWFEQALVARRQTDHAFTAETAVDCAPDHYQQAAGLTHYYNRHKLHALLLTWHERGGDGSGGRALTIASCPGVYPEAPLSFPLEDVVPVPDGPVGMRMEVDGAVLRFFWRPADAGDWQRIGPELDASVISDEGGRGEHGSFTGAFVGMVAFDISGRAMPADFTVFRYTPA